MADKSLVLVIWVSLVLIGINASLVLRIGEFPLREMKQGQGNSVAICKLFSG
jgi:hypothetical protein